MPSAKVMQAETLPGSRLLFADFLDYLRRHDFSVGVDTVLRVEKVISLVSGSCSPEDLKTLLCPVVAASKKQQALFYALFEEYFGVSPTASNLPSGALRSPEAPVDSTPFWARLWPYIIAGVLLVGLVGWGAYYREKQIQARVPPEGPTPSPTPISLPPEHRVSTLQPPPELVQALIWLGILGPPIFLILYEWYLYNRRKLLLRNLRSSQSHVLPITPDMSRQELFKSEHFQHTARQLRTRQTVPFFRLDIESSIKASIRSLGFPTLQFRSASKVPEYLALIQRMSHRDHQSRLFVELIRALEEEGVEIETYYFDDDPRVCFMLPSEQSKSPSLRRSENVRPESGSDLEVLIKPGEERRLLIFSSGESFVDPITGDMASWTSIFRRWRERALLTPRAPVEWGRREFTLSQELVVVPASIEGLKAVVDAFEVGEVVSSRGWMKEFAVPPSDSDDAEFIESLRDYLGPDVFQWLCACAIYPRLQWDLTLFIGGLPCMKPGLVTAENLVRLNRFEWFQTSSIPEHIRQLLIAELETDIEREVRRSIVALIKDSRPRMLGDRHPLNVSVPRAYVEEHFEKVRRAIGGVPAASIMRDATFARFLDSRPNRFLDFILPQALLKFFYPHGNSALRIRVGVRIALTVLFMSGSLLAAPRIAGRLRMQEYVVLLIDPSPSPSVLPSPLSSPLASSPSPGITNSPSPLIGPSPIFTTLPTPAPSFTPTPIASPTPSPRLQDPISEVQVMLLVKSGQVALGNLVQVSIVNDLGQEIAKVDMPGGTDRWEPGSAQRSLIKLGQLNDAADFCSFKLRIAVTPSHAKAFGVEDTFRYVSLNYPQNFWELQVTVDGFAGGRRVALLSRSISYTIGAGAILFIPFPCGLPN